MNKVFKVGDLILYGSTGVCRVTDITTRDFSGMYKDQLFYILIPLYKDCVISTPVNTTKIFMRPIISKDEAERLVDMIPTIRTEVCHSRVLRELTEHYEASLKTHDCAELFELTMSIYAKKQEVEQQKRKFGAIDEKFMKRAEELLFGELAAALNIPKDSVPDYIAKRIGDEGRSD
ncbi:MAG: hypothetical protein EOM54_07235 [Clostridia bacterium]|nr:hypothetical protein [Clostridia bacterium]